MTTLAREIVGVFGAQFYRNKPIKSNGEMFLDLHAHLPRTCRTADNHLEDLERRVDGYAVSSYGHWADRFTADYESYISFLKNMAFSYDVVDKGILAVATNKRTGKQMVILKGQEIDRTRQLVDITGLGITERLFNEGDVNHPESFPDARYVAERIMKQGGLAFLEHFCAVDTSLSQEITGFRKKLPWVVEDYSDERKKQELFGIFQCVDAVEVFNGVCTLYMIAQNVHSDKLVREYERKTGKSVVTLAGSDTHCNPLNVGTSGVIIPKLDLTLDGPEIIQQLKDNLKKARLVKGYPTITSFAVQMIPSIRDESSGLADIARLADRIHEAIRL